MNNIEGALQHNKGPSSVAGLVLDPHQKYKGILNRTDESIDVDILCYKNIAIFRLNRQIQFSDQASELFYKVCKSTGIPH